MPPDKIFGKAKRSVFTKCFPTKYVSGSRTSHTTSGVPESAISREPVPGAVKAREKRAKKVPRSSADDGATSTRIRSLTSPGAYRRSMLSNAFASEGRDASTTAFRCGCFRSQSDADATNSGMLRCACRLRLPSREREFKDFGTAAALRVKVAFEVKKDRQFCIPQFFRPFSFPCPHLGRSHIENRLPAPLRHPVQFHIESRIVDSDKSNAILVQKGFCKAIAHAAQTHEARDHIAKSRNRELLIVHNRFKPRRLHTHSPRTHHAKT